MSRDKNQAYDFARLARVVRLLVEKSRELERENAVLRRDLGQRDSEILELNQKRQDVAKRIDDLIAQLDHVESHAASAR